MNQSTTDEQSEMGHGRLRLWHGLVAIAMLSILFAILAQLNMTTAIVAILIALVFFGIQAVLLIMVMRWLKSQ